MGIAPMMLNLAIGNSVQWIFRTWVRAFGKPVRSADEAWIDGPVGSPERIGAEFYEGLAKDINAECAKNEVNSGLMEDFNKLASTSFNPEAIDPRIKDFYERTANYRLEVWSQWSWLFQPFARLLVHFVSRRIQQLNLPVSPLDTSRGMTSEIIRLKDKDTGERLYTCWLRKVIHTGDVIYAGFYSTSKPPRYSGECVKVVFPLPRGSATVVLKPIARKDGSLELSSAGEGFGDPGYYRILQVEGRCRKIRYIRAMKERIHVYVDKQGTLRTDHEFSFWKIRMLTLHYRIDGLKREP